MITADDLRIGRAVLRNLPVTDLRYTVVAAGHAGFGAERGLAAESE